MSFFSFSFVPLITLCISEASVVNLLRELGVPMPNMLLRYCALGARTGTPNLSRTSSTTWFQSLVRSVAPISNFEQRAEPRVFPLTQKFVAEWIQDWQKWRRRVEGQEDVECTHLKQRSVCKASRNEQKKFRSQLFRFYSPVVRMKRIHWFYCNKYKVRAWYIAMLVVLPVFLLLLFLLVVFGLLRVLLVHYIRPHNILPIRFELLAFV